MQAEEVDITGDINLSLKTFLEKKQFSKVAVLVDENTEALCLPVIKGRTGEAAVIRIKSGEENKNLKTCQLIWDYLTDAEFDRRSLLINLGGGVIGDMGGFCAATFKRGIPFINIPTTLLAQVDASVGGKLGIDYHGFKNHIGVFKTPEKVLIDPAFLKSLPKRELRSGFAEIIKHSLIADKDYWPEISSQKFEDQDWGSHIAHSIKIKSKIVHADPTENGLRKILNFGHTIGHALETDFLNQDPGKRILHGEAIAAGMICEAYLSNKKLGLSSSSLKEIQEYILKVYGQLNLAGESINRVLRLCHQDKKNERGIVNFSLLDSLGRTRFNIEVEPEEIKTSLLYYQQIQMK